jgi:hypothetical protein
MSGKQDAEKLLKELEGKMDELPMHLYVFIWSISEMNQRYASSPDSPEFNKICYPFTKVPIFSKDEGHNLEDLWRKNIASNKDFFSEENSQPKKQRGGRPKLSFKDLKEKSAKFGQAMNFAVQAIDPKKISPDYLYEYSTELMDSLDANLTEASNTFGLVALETSVPDPTLVIPTVPPVPIPIPARSILPVINAILESIRITLGIINMIDPFGWSTLFRCIVTLIMVMLDLARGNLYHAIFTSFGFLGSAPMFVGIGLKIIRDAIMLVSPDLRTEMRDILFKSSKSMTVGFFIWLFTVLSPRFVKAPLEALFMTVSTTIDNINAQLETAEMRANLSPIGKLATIKLPRIPSDKIPDINNLYALREAIREPAIFCDPKIADLMDELRGIPPYALFFDLALLPRKGTKEFDEQCVLYKGGTFSDNLVQNLTPQIIPVGSDTPINPIAATATPTEIATAAGPMPTLPTPVSATSNAPPGLASLGALAADPKAAALGALASDPKAAALGALAADPKTAALGALASGDTKGALMGALAADPKTAALGALASGDTKGALMGALSSNPQTAALGALASGNSKGALMGALAASPATAGIAAAAKDPHAAALSSLASKMKK